MTYFTAALTSPQLTKLRGPGTVDRSYAADQLLFLCPNSPVFSARVNGAVTGEPVGQIAYDTVTFGAYTDIRVGQRLTISPSNNIMDRNAITCRIRLDPTSAIIYLNEISVDIADNSYLFVTNDYPLMDRLARITQTDPTYIQSKDFDLAFELLPPLVAGIQISYVQRVDSLTGVATFSLDASLSYATDDTVYAANILDFLWEFDDAGAVNVIGGGTTQDNIEFEINEGFQWTHLTITDLNGTATTFHFQIHPWGDTYTPVLGFDGASLSGDIQNGYGVSAIAFSQVSTVLDNTWVTIVRSPEYYNSVAGQLLDGDAYYVDFVGFLSNETSSGRSDELYSAINEVSFEITGIGQRLAQIEMQAIGMRNADVPTLWDYIDQLMPWRAIVHIWARHSTASTLVPLVFTSDVLNFAYFYPYFNTQLGGNILSGVNYILNGINSALEFWPNGTVEGVRDIRYITELNRLGYTTLFGITTSDLYDISIQWQHIPPTGKIYAEGGFYNANNLQVMAVKSIAPGTAQQIGSDTGTLGQQILTEAGSQIEAQTELNQRAGNYFAILNDDGNTITLSVPGGYGAVFYPSRNILYTLTYDDPVRGITYDTSTKWMCIAVNISHNNEAGSRTVQITLQRLIPFAAPGDTIPQIAEGDIAPAIPDLPPFPAFNSEFPEFSFPLAGLDLSQINPAALDNPPGQTAKKDGSTLIIKSDDQAYLLSNVIIATTPPSYEVTPNLGETTENTPFTVLSTLDLPGNNTGVAVSVGDALYITASGTWSDGGPSGSCGPDGYPSSPGGGGHPLPSANQGALCGRIGTSGAWFLVGSSYSGTAGASGSLYLIFNDGAGFYGDNSGTLAASIDVTSQAVDIKQALFDPLNAGSNKPTANRYAYLLESSGDTSRVQRTANIFATPPTWLTGDDITGLYNVLRGTNVDGGLMIYGPSAGTGNVVVDAIVDAGTGGVDSGIDVTSGDMLAFSATGTWTNDGITFWGPDGDAGTPAPPGWALPGANNTSLLFRIGLSGAWTFAGASYSGTAGATGRLYFVDNDLIGGYFNNSGSMTVTVTVNGVVRGGSVVRYSSDRGDSWGSAIAVGDFFGSVGGFDVSRASGVSYAACAAKVRKATTLGGAYNDFLAFTGANPKAVCIPYFRIGTYPTAQQTAASDPDLYVGLDTTDSGGHSMYKCTGAGVKTGITPTSGFVFESENSITSSYGDEIAVLGLVSGDRRVYRSVNAGASWTLEASGLTSNAQFIRTRRGDNRRAKLGSGHGQGYLINGSTADYTVDWFATLATRNLPIAANGYDVLG